MIKFLRMLTFDFPASQVVVRIRIKTNMKKIALVEILKSSLLFQRSLRFRIHKSYLLGSSPEVHSAACWC